MEVVTGWNHRSFPIDDSSRVGEARRHAATLALQMSWNEVNAGRLALVVNELGTNLLRHAKKGQLLIAARHDCSEVEVLAIDHGPGISDLPRSMQDGYSTGGTPGTGLGAVRRLADDFDIHSAVPDGTVCVARVRQVGELSGASAKVQKSVVHLRAICLPAPGESVSGDAWSALIDGACVKLIVADGLGHGPHAAKASEAATEVFRRNPEADLCGTLQDAHIALQTTRGAAVCLMGVDFDASVLDYTGAGNVCGRVVSGVSDRSIMTQYGTVGLQMRKPDKTSVEWPDHGLAVVHSDGIDTRWNLSRIMPLLRRDASLIAATLLRDHTRHRDDVTIVVVRRNA